MKFLIRWAIHTLAIWIAAYLLPGVTVDTVITAFIVAVVLGVVNAVLKPILVILTLPINILTLGLFTLVINAGLILLVGQVVPGFKVDGLLWAAIFGLVVSLVNSVLHA
jgi:putative membrane protein